MTPDLGFTHHIQLKYGAERSASDDTRSWLHVPHTQLKSRVGRSASDDTRSWLHAPHYTTEV